jgi:hypothetical protein
MVHDEHLRADLCCPLDRGQAGVYGKSQVVHLVSTLHLQAVVRVIFDSLYPQIAVQVGYEIITFHLSHQQSQSGT